MQPYFPNPNAPVVRRNPKREQRELKREIKARIFRQVALRGGGAKEIARRTGDKLREKHS